MCIDISDATSLPRYCMPATHGIRLFYPHRADAATSGSDIFQLDSSLD
jgi:hypothetical protein